MLYDLNFLNPGEVFPPRSEWERLKTYRDNRALFTGDTERVLPAYRQRIRTILNKFTDIPQYDYKSDLNYWQLVTLKTGDMICGEPPTISVGGDGKKADGLRDKTGFNGKLLEAVYDVSRLGECILRIRKDPDGFGNFSPVSPDLWFPVVSYEDVKQIVAHVLAWIEDVTADPNARERRYLLKVQEHYKGYYTSRTFTVENAATSMVVMPDGLNIDLTRYKLGNEIERKERIPTGLDDFAVIALQNVTLPDSVYAQVNDYDRITSILAELEVRYALENTVLDKHSAPTVFAPEGAFVQDRQGEWRFMTGGAVRVPEGSQPPGYMTWDGNLEANHAMIEKLEKHLYSLSEMGAIVNDDAFGASQGFEALETRMMNARLKCRRLAGKFTAPVKKLISLVSQLGHGRIEADEITVCWNDGLPNNEYREADIAIKKMPLFSAKTLLMDHFDKTEKDAEEEVAERNKEQPSFPVPGEFGGSGGEE